MNYITSTELRTKSTELINSLREGSSISLIYRSKIVAVIKPTDDTNKVFTQESIDKLKKLAKKLNLPKTTYKERGKIYRKHLMDKYGKYISRH